MEFFKWEYMVWGSADPVVHERPVIDHLNALGKAGWEAYACLPNGKYYTYFFKRKVTDYEKQIDWEQTRLVVKKPTEFFKEDL